MVVGSLGVAFLISSYLNKKSLKKTVNDNQRIGKTYYPNKIHSKYLKQKYLKYKKLRQSLNNIW